MSGRKSITRVDDIVVIGAGIAGSALAILLAQQGRNVSVVNQPGQPDLLVGESLLPATIPIIQELGLEQEMRGFSRYKPGAAFVMRDGRSLLLDFATLDGVTSTYAYNIPRPQFDDAMRRRAQAAGAKLVDHHFRGFASGDRVLLDHETLAACGLTRQPDLVVDCSGRAQVLRHVLGIDGSAGPRRDSCLFAHYANVELGVPIGGVVVITVMKEGWSWRIPLADRTSVGVVVPRSRLGAYGRTAEERLAGALAADWIMRDAVAGSTRLTDVRKYTNYQWVTDRFVGANWVMVGDSAGFVDPALSSGVLLALQGASGLAETLLRREGCDLASLGAWEKGYRSHIVAWQALVDAFYDGRLFSMIMQGRDFEKRRWLGPVNRHLATNFAGVVMGATTMSPYSRRLVRFLLSSGIRNYHPDEWAVA